jgi:hypothetical protein
MGAAPSGGRKKTGMTRLLAPLLLRVAELLDRGVPMPDTDDALSKRIPVQANSHDEA